MKTKLFLKIAFLLFSLNTFASTNDLELIAVKNENSMWKLDYILKIRNNGTTTVKFLKANDISYMNAGLPSIEFVAETQVNGIWKKFKDPKIGQIDYYTNALESYIITLKPNEEIQIGHLYRNRDISSWFTLLDDAKIRVYFIYKTGVEKEDKSELKRVGIPPIALTSNKIEIDYKNTLSKKSYQEAKKNYINYALREYVQNNYTSIQLLKSMKKIKNTNGEYSEILSEVLGDKPFKFIDNFSGATKDGYNYRGILYKLDNKIHLGIYAGKHYFIKNKDKNENQPLEYLFGEVTFDQNILTNFLYQN